MVICSGVLVICIRATASCEAARPGMCCEVKLRCCLLGSWVCRFSKPLRQSGILCCVVRRVDIQLYFRQGV